MLLGTAVRGAVIGGSASGAATFVNRQMQPTRSVPIWQGTMGDTTLALMQTIFHDRYVTYELHAITGGTSQFVGWYYIYPQALAAIQQWQGFLGAGGTIQSWLEHGQRGDRGADDAPTGPNVKSHQKNLRTGLLIAAGVLLIAAAERQRRIDAVVQAEVEKLDERPSWLDKQ
jgi:hypothetical protein